MYRLNTFPVIHMGFFHAFLNLLALTPLMERFEGEYGTLTSLALFFGRESYPPTDLPVFPPPGTHRYCRTSGQASKRSNTQ